MGDSGDGWGKDGSHLGGGLGSTGGHRISDDEHEDKAFMTFRGMLKGQENFLEN